MKFTYTKTLTLSMRISKFVTFFRKVLTLRSVFFFFEKTPSIIIKVITLDHWRFPLLVMSTNRLIMNNESELLLECKI